MWFHDLFELSFVCPAPSDKWGTREPLFDPFGRGLRDADGAKNEPRLAIPQY